MAQSTRIIHPLDVENNSRYKVAHQANLVIPWVISDDLQFHDSAGYIRIPEDGDYTFKIQVDDNGYIEVGNKRVVEVTGSNSSTSAEGTVFLEKGFHYAKLHHQNLPVPDAIAPYPNAMQFEPLMNGVALELWGIDEPKNRWKLLDARKLLQCYNVVDYKTKGTDEVWAYVGGWLNKEHLDEIEANVPQKERNYYNSCALRLSIALSSYGISLEGAPGSNLADKNGLEVLGGKKHVIISAREMVEYLTKFLGVADYKDASDKGYSTPQEGDIIVFGAGNHVGMCFGNDPDVGGFIAGSVWLLQRSKLDD